LWEAEEGEISVEDHPYCIILVRNLAVIALEVCVFSLTKIPIYIYYSIEMLTTNA
jgi:hypothetical protein